MKISTRLTLAAFVPVFMLLVVGLTLVYSLRTLDAAKQDMQTARELANNSADLNGFVYSYILHQDERPKEQFIAAHDSIDQILSGADFGGGRQRELLDGIRANNDSVNASFLSLVSANESGAAESEIHRQQEEQLIGQILLGSQEMRSDALSLQSITADDLSESHRQVIVVILLAVAFTTIPLAVVLFQMMRNIGRSLSKLRQGIEVIGAGNLDYRIGISGRHELAALGRAFDEMTGRLQTVTVSKDALEREVEERKRAEEALRRSEERWATTLASIGDAVVATDLDGAVAFMNPVAEELTGWKATEASGKRVEEVLVLINAQTRERVQNPVDKVLSDGRTAGLANHTILVRKDGSEVPIDDSAAPIRDREGRVAGVILVFRDITERKEAEAARLELAGQRQLALDAAHLGWWHYDPTTRMAKWDEGYKRIFGVEGYERLNDEILQQIIHPEDLPELWAKVEAALDSADPRSYVAEYRINRPDGATRWIRAYGLASFEGEGEHRQATSLVGTVEDITERKLAEDELRAALAAKDDFLSMVSHEMRTPLTAVLGNALILLEPGLQPDDLEDQRGMLTDIAEGAKRLAGTIDNMLALARVETGRKTVVEPLTAQTIVHEVVEQHRMRHPHRKIEVRSDVSLQVMASKEYLQHIVSNLLENAEKYTPRDEPITVELDCDGKDVRVRFLDRGIGLTAEEAAHIFEPFYRSARIAAISPGMGIGLSVCKRLVEEQSGRIWVESAGEGEGSAFAFTLPVAGSGKPPAAESSPPKA